MTFLSDSQPSNCTPIFWILIILKETMQREVATNKSLVKVLQLQRYSIIFLSDAQSSTCIPISQILTIFRAAAIKPALH